MRRVALLLLAALIPAVWAPAARAQQEAIPTLTLDDAIRLALQRNKVLKVSSYGPGIARANLLVARGAFDPALVVNRNYSESQFNTKMCIRDRLTVTVDRLTRWSRGGLLCIGDAAHAMSPVGGVGINLAIQDAVAAANLLAAKLLRRNLNERDLEAVKRRRQLPTRLTQALQILIQDRVVAPVITGKNPKLKPPLPLRLVGAFPWLQVITARLVGLGFRPEHIRSPEAAAPRR